MRSVRLYKVLDITVYNGLSLVEVENLWFRYCVECLGEVVCVCIGDGIFLFSVR